MHIIVETKLVGWSYFELQISAYNLVLYNNDIQSKHYNHWTLTFLQPRASALASFSVQQSVGGIMVSIAAFQAVDPGSIPGRRSTFCCYIAHTRCLMNWNLSTRATIAIILWGSGRTGYSVTASKFGEQTRNISGELEGLNSYIRKYATLEKITQLLQIRIFPW